MFLLSAGLWERLVVVVVGGGGMWLSSVKIKQSPIKLILTCQSSRGGGSPGLSSPRGHACASMTPVTLIARPKSPGNLPLVCVITAFQDLWKFPLNDCSQNKPQTLTKGFQEILQRLSRFYPDTFLMLFYRSCITSLWTLARPVHFF